MSSKWYRLDNAAKIFPAVSNSKRANVFRLSFEMKDTIDPLLLQKALEVSIERFPMLRVKLKRGLFWFYFEDNENTPMIEEESPSICRMFTNSKDNGEYMFRVSFFNKRIALETFHSLTDGTGALEFLKSIVYNYLKLKDNEFEGEEILTTDIEINKEEMADFFNVHYNAKLKNTRKEYKSLKYSSPQYDDDWMGVIVGTVDVNDLKAVSKKFNCTITELLASLVIYSSYRRRHIFENKNKPYTMFIPVNLRRFFPSKTLRNFSLYVRTMVDFTKQLTFEDIIEIVKGDMKDELQKEKLQMRFTANVRTERNFALRLAPVFIKQFAMKIGYNLLADQIHSFSFSNIGFFDLPDQMKKHIDKVIFTTGCSKNTPINLGVISFNGKAAITFSSYLIDRSIQKYFFRFLANEGLKIVIESNELEV